MPAGGSDSQDGAARGPGGTVLPNPSYTELLNDVDARIAGLQSLVDQQPGDWLKREHLAGLYMERVGLTNEFGDYVHIGKLLDEAFAIAPQGSGPNYMAAKYNFGIHRISGVEPYLAQFEKKVGLSDIERGDIAMLRGDVAYHSSDYARAFKLYREGVALAPDLDSLSRLSDYHWRTGGWQEALGLLALCEKQYILPSEHQLRAWLFVQRGSMFMERGMYSDALSAYEAAEVEVPDWWLVQEHIARVYALQDRNSDAIKIFEHCIEQSGHPDEMDELAALYREQGKTDPALEAKAQALIRQSRELWDKRVAELPEAALGHMINHCLKFETDMNKLCEVAEQNFAARRTGLAYVKLAQAYFKAGRSADARRVVDECLATPYETPALYGIASKVYAARGDSSKAELYRQRCLALNPRYPGVAPKEGAAVAENGGADGNAAGALLDSPGVGTPGGA